MTIIKSAEIPYLNEDVIEKYSNVIVKSVEGLMMKMNALMLCAMSPTLKIALLEFDDFYGDYMITTEFSLEELKQVKDYCMKGSYDAMTESIMNSFGLLTPLTVSLKRQEKWNERSKAVVTDFDNSSVQTIIPVKNEIIDIKDEPLEDVEFDFALGYSSDDSLPLSNFSKTVKAQKRQKRSFKEDDNEWKPEKVPGNHNKMPKVQGRSRQKTSNKLDDNDWEPEKSKTQEKRGNNFYKWSDNDLELFKKFELPKTLQEYISKPKKIDSKKIEESMNDEKKQFQCSQCQMKFAVRWNLEMHVIKCHNEHLPCPHCGMAFFVNDTEDFKKHIFMHMNLSKNSEKLKPCVQCGKNYGHAKQFKKHFKQRGPLHNDECTQCLKKFTTFKEYQDHVNNQHYGVWQYRCGFENCGEMFDDDKKCQKHERLVHRQHELRPKKEAKPKSSGKLIGVCELCGFHYKTHSAKSYHMKYHHNDEDLNKICPHCNKTTPRLKEHLKSAHLEIMCPQCGKMVSGTMKLRNHIRSAHTSMEDRPLKCTTCGKGFFEKNALDDHYNVHTGAKPFKCTYCPAAFASKGTHAMHQKSHLGIKRNYNNK